MDFYFVKYKFRGRVTGEDGVGYFFGKVNDAPEYDLIVVPTRFANYLSIDLSADYVTFTKNFSELKRRIFQQIPEAEDMTRELSNYLKSYINRKGGPLFGSELTAAIQGKDADLVHYIIQEVFKEWAPKVEVAVEFSEVTHEELSAESFTQLLEEFENEGFADTLKRADLVDLPEVFPLIDPIKGRTIADFDLGDPIFFVVLNVRKPEHLELLKTLYPKHFSKGVNVVPLAGTLIAKELVKGKKTDYFLIKVDMGNGFVGKAIVPKSIKVMSDYSRYEEKISQMEEKSWESKIEEMLKEEKAVVRPAVQGNYKAASSFEKQDLLIAFLLTLMILGIVLVFSYFFML
ncbi:DUF4899 domain-containing protein [Pseudothermotoga thermarum]|uniref:DUF4899 domain-containing protein n=1 Tax=Pseudothermotoga thermarum DSM 5069 TaxID=688269 RepID=F7YUF2_9THEM|nr:DUF4899 domain-containing protein [Pseudothermotoga thermarum]AEH51355.1 hypothetical protein Theth_1284 [Pseudothermotoga thermarum DSM 5069]